MRKILAFISVLVLVGSILCSMTACNGKRVSESETTAKIDEEPIEIDETEKVVDKDDIISMLRSDYDAVPIEFTKNLEQTTWTLFGGIVDGSVLEDADVQKMIDDYNGFREYSFWNEEDVRPVIKHVPGEEGGTILITARMNVMNDGYVMEFEYNKYRQEYCILTLMEDKTVLIVVSNENPDELLYYAKQETDME